MAKSIITYESLRKDLIATYEKNVRSIPSFIFGALIILLVPIGYGIYIICDDKFIFGIITIIVSVIIFLYFTICCTIFTFVDLKMIRQNKFSIIKDTVVKIETLRGRSSVSYVAHFRYSGKYFLSNVEQALTSVDDEFYLVILGKHIIRAYNTTLYEYKEPKK